MTTDTPPNKLYPALLAAQRAMGPVRKDAKNPAFRSSYATLQSVFDTIEGPLWENGIIIVQRFNHDDTGGSLLVTELIHAESGQSITSNVPILSKDPHDPQKVGSAITYYRRYSLMSLLGLTAEDDDGNSASKPAPQPIRETWRPPGPTPARPASPAAPASAQSTARLDTDQVLTILGEMDDSREPWHEIKRYADDQSVTREGDDVLRIHDKLRAIASRRRGDRTRAGRDPASEPRRIGRFP